jgi:hypothetical protein
VTDGAVIALVAALVTNAIAFGATLIKIGRLGERLDLLWAWYLAEHGFERRIDPRLITPRELRRMRRPTATREANDPPAAAAGE